MTAAVLVGPTQAAPRQLGGEAVAVPERMIVAPSIGRFRSPRSCIGVFVDEGDQIGVIEGPASSQQF